MPISEQQRERIASAIQLAIESNYIVGNTKNVTLDASVKVVTRPPTCVITEDGRVNVFDADVTFAFCHQPSLFKDLAFDHVGGTFDWFAPNYEILGDMWSNMPNTVAGRCTIKHKHVRKVPQSCWVLATPNVTDLDQLAVVLKSCVISTGHLIVSQLATPLLRLLMVPPVLHVEFPSYGVYGTHHQDTAFDIINKHLVKDRDIILCQEHLIEAGFASFARL